jgi:hypothetical protein
LAMQQTNLDTLLASSKSYYRFLNTAPEMYFSYLSL